MALSRATSLDSLQVIGFQPTKVINVATITSLIQSFISARPQSHRMAQ
jgi:hypothetical protein